MSRVQLIRKALNAGGDYQPLLKYHPKQEADMAGGDNPLLLTEMMSQGFEQTRKAMETYAELFQKTMKPAIQR
jgi:hypothetical protein